tara:strand:- start:5053 stop:6906 length:1854 start_codon:yes stop_codon:yes gene_type:complete
MGKHEGHAVESVIKGICNWICKKKGENFTVIRKDHRLPLTMDTDIVIKEKNIIQSIIMISHSDNDNYSHRKVKRLNEEYVEVVSLHLTKHKFLLSNSFRIVNFIFGMPSGWKESQIIEMKEEMSPTIFLPEIISPSNYDKFISTCMKLYSENPREVESKVQNNPKIIKIFDTLAPHLEKNVFDNEIYNNLNILKGIEKRKTSKEKLPSYLTPKSFNTRYRQGLSMLGVFSTSEQEFLFNKMNQWIDPDSLSLAEKEIIRRIKWLDYCTFEKNIKNLIILKPKIGDRESLPDFSQPYKTLNYNKSNDIINILDDYALKNSSTFAAGIQCLSIGNYEKVVPAIKEAAELLIDFINKKKKDFFNILKNDIPLIPDKNRWKHSNKKMMVLRTWLISLLVVLTKNRNLLSKLDFKAAKPFQRSDQKILMKELKGLDNKLLVKELENTISFFDDLFSNDVNKILGSDRPLTFDFNTPGSWAQRLYFVLTSHAAYNPINVILYLSIIDKRHKGKKFGFPEKLAVPLSHVMTTTESSIKFRHLVQEDNIIHVYEAFSITANHIGDKSKELFNRIGKAKRAAADSKNQIIFHGLFDGDFNSQVIKEFISEDRYDEFISIEDAIINL